MSGNDKPLPLPLAQSWEKENGPNKQQQQQKKRKLSILIFSVLLVAGYLLRERIYAAAFEETWSLSTLAANDEDWRSLKPGTVRWWDCAGEKGAIPGAECGYIIVPTDYFNSSAGVTKIALGRYKARRQRQGIVLVNPGGPGGSGKLLATLAGSMLQTSITSETYDIIGFDPRGIGESLPRTRCFSSPAQEVLLKRNTVLDKGFDVGGNLSSPRLRAELEKGLREADAIYRAEMALCGERMGEQLRYMGTASVVRDLDYMTRVLEGEEALINFWGASYGSIMGQYLVNMMPDRIGRVAIDGIADAVAWSNEPNYKWYRPWLSSTELAYSTFLSACSKAGSYECPLTLWKDEEPEWIRRRLERWMDELYEKPLVVADLEAVGVVTAGMARSFLLGMLEQPRTWRRSSGILAAALAGSGRLLLQSSSSSTFSTPDLTRQAVSCNDALPLTPSTAPSYQDVLDEYIDTMRTETKFVMSVVTSEPDSGCQYWPVRPVERFEGPWNSSLRNPIVVFSNTADPVTPISSARHVKSLLGSSAVLALQNAPGHCTLSLPSICTMRKYRAFFEYGALPEDGHVCEVSVGPFPEDPLEVGMQSLDEEATEILQAGMGLGEVLGRMRRGDSFY